jgi:hypothetical protein
MFSRDRVGHSRNTYKLLSIFCLSLTRDAVLFPDVCFCFVLFRYHATTLSQNVFESHYIEYISKYVLSSVQDDNTVHNYCRDDLHIHKCVIL